jgi:hypothetical protein
MVFMIKCNRKILIQVQQALVLLMALVQSFISFLSILSFSFFIKLPVNGENPDVAITIPPAMRSNFDTNSKECKDIFPKKKIYN